MYYRVVYFVLYGDLKKKSNFKYYSINFGIYFTDDEINFVVSKITEFYNAK